MKTTKQILTIVLIFIVSLHFAQAQNDKLKDTTTLKQVQVIATIKPVQGITVISLDSEALHRSSGLSLQDAINLVPGVEMQNREAWGGDRIIMRGYIPNIGTPTNLSVNTGSGYGYMAYINNIPITDATGNTIMDDIDNSEIGRVDIIKGPASSLYGSYIGGSLHFFTPTVTPGTTSIQEQVIGGSYGLFRNNTTIATATDKSSIWINYGGQTYNGFRPNDGSQDQFASFAGDFKTSNKNTISTYFSYNYSNQQLSGELDSNAVYGRKAIGDTNYDRNFSRVTLESARGGINDKYQISKYLSNEVAVYLTNRVIDQVIAHGYTDYTENDFGGRDAFDFHDGIVDGIVGGSFQKLDQTSDGYSVAHTINPPFVNETSATLPYTAFTPSAAQNFALNYNIFTQWSVKLPYHFTLTVGGSMNYSEYYIQNMLDPINHEIENNPPIYGGPVTPAFTPSASLIKMLNPNVSVYVSVGTGYTPPGLSNILETNNVIDYGLKPERGVQYELGTKGTLLKGKFSYQLALYDLDITNRLIQEDTGGYSYYTNVGEQRDMGVELYMAYNAITNQNGVINELRPWVSYTYDDAKYITFNTYTFNKTTNKEYFLAEYSGNKAVGVAPNTANAGMDVGAKMGFYLHVTYQYVDKVPFTFDNEHYMSSYSLLNGRLGYAHKFGHFSLDAFVGVNNALGQTYYTSVFFADKITDLAQGSDPNYFNQKTANRGSGGDGYILPAPYDATFYGGLTLKYTF